MGWTVRSGNTASPRSRRAGAEPGAVVPGRAWDPVRQVGARWRLAGKVCPCGCSLAVTLAA